jgi:hypothetical protein
MGRKVCTSNDLLWTAKIAAQYAKVSETLVKKAMVEGMLTTCDPFGNDRDLRTTQIWVDEWLNTLLSKKSRIQQARDILTRQRYV